jgi:DNA-binding transcriptional LysR family regulator
MDLTHAAGNEEPAARVFAGEGSLLSILKADFEVHGLEGIRFPSHRQRHGATHITQSAVTRRVQSLEDMLGVSLLDRQTRPLQPTLAGRQTFEFARPVICSVSDLKTAITQNGEPSGDFRFGLPRSFDDTTLAGPIQELRTKFPKLKVHAFVQWSSGLLESLANRKLDAAIINLPEGSVPPVSLVSERIGTKPIRVLAAESARVKQPVTLKELSATPWIVHPAACPTRQLLETVLLQQGLPFETAVETEGYELQFSLISNGVGLGLAPSDVFHSSPQHKNMKVLKVKDFSPKLAVWLLHSKHIGRLAPVVRYLRDAVQQHLKLWA